MEYLNKNQPMSKNDKLDSSEFEWAIGLNRIGLRLIGVWPNHTKEDTAMNIRAAGAISSLIFCLFIPQMWALMIVRKNLLLVMDNALTSVPALASATKIFFLWNAQTTLGLVVQNIATDWSECRLDWERKIMLKRAHRGRLFTIFGMVLISLTFLMAISGPFFGISYRVFTNLIDHSDRHLPVQAYLPYDTSKTPNFEITYLGEVVGLGLVAICFTMPANFFMVLVLHVSGQIQILAKKMMDLGLSGDSKQFSTHLRQIVNRHVHIIRMVNDIEKAFNMLILAQLVVLSIMICSLGFQFLNAMDTSNTVERTSITRLFILGGAFLNMTLHTFTYCLAGEILTFESMKLNFEGVGDKWYMLSKRNVRDLLPIMIRSNDLLKLTGGSYFPLSLHSFCQILKTSVGYMSMLIALKNK